MNLKAIFPSGATELTVNGLHQWDYGRKLDIHAPDLPALVEVHFACSGMDEAIVRVSSAVGGVASVAIPDRCLEQSSPITAWVYEVGETSGQTIKTLTLNIKARTRPQAEGTIDPETSDKYTEAVGAMNETIAKMLEQFLLKEGGRISGRLFVDGDLMEVGGTREGSNRIGVTFVDGEPGGTYIVRELNLFGNGSPANGETSQPGVRGLYDSHLNKNIIEIDKSGKVTLVGEADSAKTANSANSADSADKLKSRLFAKDAVGVVDIYETGIFIVDVVSPEAKDGYNNINTTVTIFIDKIDGSKRVSFKYSINPTGEANAWLCFQGGMRAETGEAFGQLYVDGDATWVLNVVKIANL